MHNTTLDGGGKFTALLAVLILACMYKAPPMFKSGKNVLREPNLKAWYDGYNEEYFQYRLPNDTQVDWADLTVVDALGATWQTGNGYRIEIDKNYNVAPITMQLTLLHEMCHVEVATVEEQVPNDGDHGVAFQDCMMELAKEGAFHDLW